MVIHKSIIIVAPGYENIGESNESGIMGRR